MRRQNSMIFGKCKVRTARNHVLQILSKFLRTVLTTIPHFYVSRVTRVILKCRILMNIKFLCFQCVRLVKQLSHLPKIH